MAAVLGMLPKSEGEDRPRLGWRSDLVTVLLGAWLMVGLFIDGWAHTNLEQLETFFTPWHAVFYSGYLANVAWMVWSVARYVRVGRKGLSAVPVGYDLGVLGVLIFAVGGVGDMLWHMIFGIEQDLEALLSPTHLLLFIGGALIITSPFRAAWAATEANRDRPSLKEFLPTLLSITLVTCSTAFMFLYLWGLGSARSMAAGGIERLVRHFAPVEGGSDFAVEFTQFWGISSILISNLLLMAPVLLMLRRWRPPFGSVTIFLVATTVLMAAVREFRLYESIPVAVAAGLVADWLVHVLRPTPNRVGALRVFATVVPLVLWSLYFLAVQLRWGVGWSPEMWTGVIAWTGISGFGLSVVMAPSGVPQRHDGG